MRGLPLRRTWSRSGQQAEFGELGQGLAGGGAGGAGAEGGGVGVVDVGDAVLGAVDEGDQGREPAEDLADGELVDGGRRAAASPVELLGAGRGPEPVRCALGRGRPGAAAVVGPRVRRGAAFRGAGRSSA